MRLSVAALTIHQFQRERNSLFPYLVIKYLVTLLLGLNFLPLVSQAQFFQGFEAQIGTEVPVGFELRGKINFPSSWYGIIGLGMAPKFMTEAYGSMSSELGFHGKKTSQLISAAIANNVIMDFRLGYEFGGNSNGVYVDFGYAFSAGKGSESTMDIVEGALNADFYGVPQTAIPTVSSTVHNLVAHIGYTYRLSNSLILAFEGGVVKPLASTSEVSFDRTVVSTYSEDIIDKEVDKYLSGVYLDEMVVPTLSLWMSYLF